MAGRDLDDSIVLLSDDVDVHGAVGPDATSRKSFDIEVTTSFGFEVIEEADNKDVEADIYRDDPDEELFDIEVTTSFGFEVIEEADNKDVEADIYRDDPDEELLGLPTYTKKGGCMICQEEVEIKAFEDLFPGDHIATRGQICCIKYCYDHHAIVTEVKKLEGNTADIHVVDVNRKGMKPKWSCKKARCCCCDCWRCSCIQCRYPIEEHKLFDKTWSLFSNPDPNIVTQQLKRIDYKKRRNTPANTKKLARTFVGKEEQNNLEYSVYGQNCEHFATVCANGPENMTFDTLKDSISIQSRSCCWRLLHIIFFLIQASFYALNFCIYAVFVAKDDDFNIFSSGLEKFLHRICYHPHNCVRGFDTTCDWTIVGFFVLAFAILFTIGLLVSYQPLYTKGLICKQCLIMARLDCFTRILTFVIFEASSIFLENPTYKHVTQWKTGKWTFVIVVIISAIGALMIYSVSSALTWVLGSCCVPTCKDACRFYTYFRFRGLCWCFCGLVRCCRRKVCRRIRERCCYKRRQAGVERKGYVEI